MPSFLTLVPYLIVLRDNPIQRIVDRDVKRDVTLGVPIEGASRIDDHAVPLVVFSAAFRDREATILSSVVALLRLRHSFLELCRSEQVTPLIVFTNTVRRKLIQSPNVGNTGCVQEISDRGRHVFYTENSLIIAEYKSYFCHYMGC
jgi:hypothetical protein